MLGDDDNGLDTSFLGGDPGSLLTNLQDKLHGDEYNAPASRDALDSSLDKQKQKRILT